MTVAYHGAGFHGFAPNPGVPTVGGTLSVAASRVLGRPVEVTCAGRTDKGVHGWGQVVSFDVPAGADIDRLTASLNSLCGPRIVVRDAEAVSGEFDARFSARWRLYRYTVLNRPVPDPFLSDIAWHVPDELSVDRLRLGCDPLIGEHDFSSFCRRPKGQAERSSVRNVTSARWELAGDGVLQFWIQAGAFCHQMVRSIVGTLVEVGRGRIAPGEIAGIIAARDRAAAGPVAPAHGLCLWQVGY